MRNYKYLLASFSMAGYCFSVTGLQYFFTDYILTAINVDGQQSRAWIYTTFFTTALIAPALGSILARYLSAPTKSSSDGLVTSQLLGILCLFAFFTTVLILPLPQVNDLYTIFALLSLIFFLLGAIMPLLSGVFLFSVPSSHRVVASSVATTI
jgi:hypothetical protein